jgi:hypothetical protein
MSYITIHNGEGDTIVNHLSKGELLKRLKENYWGEDIKFLGNLPNGDTNYWGCNLLIIKGEIVTPKAVEKVVEYDI